MITFIAQRFMILGLGGIDRNRKEGPALYVWPAAGMELHDRGSVAVAEAKSNGPDSWAVLDLQDGSIYASSFDALEEHPDEARALYASMRAL